MDAPYVAPSRVTQKIFAVLVEWYHRIVLTMSFKLVSFFLHLLLIWSTCIQMVFMKILRTGSKQTVEECQKYFFLPVSRRIDIPTVRFLDRFKASETSLCNVFREQASRHMSENSPVNLVCLNCLCGGCYVMRYVRRTLVTVSEMWTVDYWLSCTVTIMVFELFVY